MLSVSLVIVGLLFMQGYFVVKACDIKCKKVSLFILIVLFSVVLFLLVTSAVVRK